MRPSGEEILIGEFHDPTCPDDMKRWLVVANRDAFNPHEATVEFTSSDVTVERMDKETAEWVPVEVTVDGGGRVTLSLEEGSGELLQVSGGGWEAVVRDAE